MWPSKKALNSKKVGWGWLSLSYLVCGLGLGLSFGAVLPFQSSTFLWGFLGQLSIPTTCMLDRTVDRDALSNVGQNDEQLACIDQ